jgi:hypothetical protein
MCMVLFILFNHKIKFVNNFAYSETVDDSTPTITTQSKSLCAVKYKNKAFSVNMKADPEIICCVKFLCHTVLSYCMKAML